MPRLPYVDPRNAPAPVRETMERLPVELNIFKMLANADTLFRPFLGLGTAILGSMELDARTRELVILHVGRMSRGEYEWVQHVPIAEAVGASHEQIAALERGETDAVCFDERDKAILRFTTEVVRDVKASDASFSAVKRHLGAREIVELILTIGYYMIVARVTETTDIDIDGPVGTRVVDAVAGGRRPA
jgi:alkylhydroperoxidase family enzyme